MVWTQRKQKLLKRGGNTEGLYKKDIHDPDNHDGMITLLEPDILECEVKWANITTNKASGGDGIPVELFQILKDDVLKVQYSIQQQIRKTQLADQEIERQDFSQKENDGGAGVGGGTGFAVSQLPRASFPLPPCPR